MAVYINVPVENNFAELPATTTGEPHLIRSQRTTGAGRGVIS